MKRVFLGIDVQINRGAAWAALDEDRSMIGSGWLPQAGAREVAAAALVVAQELEEKWESEVVVGIDAPRCPLQKPRAWYWNGAKGSWRPRRPTESGHGRHCEVIVNAARLANPQWTPLAASVPEWMTHGFALFDGFDAADIRVHEVFPSASYRSLDGVEHLPVTMDFASFARGPKDLLDALVGAFTLLEFEEGRGCEVGTDGLGSIILPRPLPSGISPALLAWPGSTTP